MSDFVSFTGAIEGALKLIKGGELQIFVESEGRIPGMLIWNIKEIEQ